MKRGAPKGERNGKAKITYEIATEIRVKYKLGSYSQLKLALEYDISQKAVWAIVNNITWQGDK